MSKLPEVESNNNKNELSIYCKFLSEKVVLESTRFYERVLLENAFTVRCDLQLYNNRTSMHESMRKDLPFILLPDKLTFFRCDSEICYYSRLNKTEKN